MILFLGHLSVAETLIAVLVAVLVFGKRLPSVAAQAAVRVLEMRRAFSDLRRETGIDEELRQARKTFEDATRLDQLDTPRIGEDAARGRAPTPPAWKPDSVSDPDEDAADGEVPAPPAWRPTSVSDPDRESRG